MRVFAVSLAVSALLAGSTALLADPIPYPNTGTIASTVTLITTGTSISVYYDSSSAADNDEIKIVDLTTPGDDTSAFFPNNGATAVGAKDTFTVSAGDTIAIDLINVTTGYTYSSDPALSPDGDNHAYITPYTASDPALGTLASGGAGDYYVGLEDLYIPGSDLDYNDETVVITNVTSPAPTPEPGSIILLGTGLLGAAGIIRRRFLAS